MILLYGSYGYTGGLIVREAIARGVDILLAGRDAARVEAQAKAAGLPWRAFPLDSPDLTGVSVVLHCAGPFVRTARPMVDACLRAGVHYLDITGEIPVFEALAARGEEATRAGIVLLPGVGYDVVPSDCLAAHLARRLPGATSLWLALASRGGLSHGTATTMLTLATEGGAVRRGGRIQAAAVGSDVRRVDFGDRERTTVAIPWGDVSTAFHSTGIPDVTVYTSVSRNVATLARWGGWSAQLLRLPFLRRHLQAKIDAAPPGPDDAQRAAGWARIVGEVATADGRTARARLLTPEGYTLTARTGLESALRVDAGAVVPGFHTPSRAFGPDYILEFEGCERVDLD